jgi:hypothetical protein
MSDLRVPERRPMPRQRKAARRDHLIRELRAPQRRRPRFGRRALLLVPIGVTLAGGALAATQIWQSSHPADIVRVQCYERASIEPRHREASSDVLGLRGPRQRARGATAMCADLWRHGALGDTGKVPQLEACVYRGRNAVFPGPPGTCVALAMRPVRGFERGQAELVARLDELVALLGRCGDPDEISRQLDAAVRRRGGEPLHLDLPLAPGRDCGPALPRRTALRVAMLGSISGESFMPPAFMGCEESYGGVEQAPAGTNCSLGLGGPRAPLCPDGAQAEQLVRHALERRGLGDWRIVVVPPESFSSRYCYVYSRVYPQRDEVRLRSMVDDPNR